MASPVPARKPSRTSPALISTDSPRSYATVSGASSARPDVQQLLKPPVLLVWGRLNTYVSHKMRDLIDARARLTVVTLPAYAPS